MKNARTTVWMVSAVLVIAAEQGFGLTEFKDGAVHNINSTINDDVWVDYQAPSMQTTVNLLPSGNIPSFLYAYNNSLIAISGGMVGHLYLYDSSLVTISNGYVGEFIARHSSQVTMSDGSVSEFIAFGNSHVIMSGGWVQQISYAYNSSVITMSGGSMSRFRALGSSLVTISNGSVGELEADGSSQVTMTGGSVGWLPAFGNSHVIMSGGWVQNELHVFDSGQVTMSGGTISSKIRVIDNAVLIIKGFNFAIDGNSVGFGEITSLLGGDYNNEPVRHLTGTLLSGELLNNDFRIGNNAKIVLAPEPTPPIADADGTYTIYVGDTLTLDASGSTDDDNDIVSYLWDLDDNNSFETDAGSNAVFDVNYTYLQSLGLLVGNTYKIHLKVTDGGGLSNIANSTLTIIPTPALLVYVDIKPGSCPNPLNVKSSGVLPVAILGTADFDVTTIDATSIRLAGVSPLRSSIEDVAGPAIDSNDCNCTEDGPDGLADLTLKFKTQDIVEAIGDVNYGDILTLQLAGVLAGERPIEGADCVVIVGKHKPCNKFDVNKDGVVDARDFAIFAENWLQSSIEED